MPTYQKPAHTRLGQRLRELRGRISLYEIEKCTGIARTLLSRYEQGKHIPTKPGLERLAKLYEVPYAELRLLQFEDQYTGTEDEPILLAWAKTHLKQA